jgi:dihydroorotase
VLVVDPERRMTVRESDQLSKAAYSPFDGLQSSATLERVFLRGREVVNAHWIDAMPAGIDLTGKV